MEQYLEGLRCQDVNLGMRELDPNSARLNPVERTRRVGMAADLAGLIKGRNIIDNIDALKTVASETLDINPFALDPALKTLEHADLVTLDRNQHGEVVRITENIPVFRDLYEDLGGAWRAVEPRQVEESLVAVVNRLARGPMPMEGLYEEIGLGRADADELYRLGRDTTLFKTVASVDGQILYSPYTAFENPQAMSDVLRNHGPGQLADELGLVAGHQGHPVDPASTPALADAVALGLITAPAVVTPDQSVKAFASVPYTVDKELLTVKKMVLDKALAIVACVRCGELFGGASRTRAPLVLLDALVTRGELAPHSSHERQYKLMRDQGVVRFLPDTRPGGSWKRVALVRTAENLEAIAIARALLAGDDMTGGRESTDEIRNLLDLDARALRPLQTTRSVQRTKVLAEPQLSAAFEQLMGRGPL